MAADDAAADPKAVRYVLALAEVNQAVWVLHQKGDAGAFNEGDWQALPEKVRAQLRIFERSRPIQRGLIAFRGDLAPATRRAIEDAMLALHQDAAGLAALTTPPASRASSASRPRSTTRCSPGRRSCCPRAAADAQDQHRHALRGLRRRPGARAGGRGAAGGRRA